MEQTYQKRPIGITIIAILMFIQFCFAMCLSTLGIVKSIFVAYFFPAVGVAVYLFLVFGAVLSLSELVLAYGLWTLRRWAFWATVIIECLNVVLSLVVWLSGKIYFSTFLWNIAIPVIILVYFLADRNVREAFRSNSVGTTVVR
jgi:hypothetical protein